MLQPLIQSATLATLALMVPAASTTLAEAGSRRQNYQAAAPLKDCTRFNARFGYYGNPWCNAAEQARWDRWDAAHRIGK